MPCLETTVGEPGDGAVLYLFGGGFVLGGPFEDVRFSAPLAAGLGLRVVAPYYPLAPEHPFPAAVDAATAVWRELLDTWPADRLAGTCVVPQPSQAPATPGRARMLRHPPQIRI